MDYVKRARTLSLLGQRGTFGTVLRDLAQDDERIIAISADLTRTSGLERFASDFPGRLVNAGIAEQSALGFAAGVADAGMVPFITTFANFAALRANEFARHFMAYMQCNVKLVGFGAGFAMELFGNTHYGLEDMAVLRSMPNLTILSPSDCLEVAKCVEWCVQAKGPVYLRLTGRMGNPIVYRSDYSFEPGRAVSLREGSDAAIFATGSMVAVAMKAADLLAEQGFELDVVNMHTIRPIDREAIVSRKSRSVIVTIEEHSVIGGLGSAVAEVLAECTEHGELVRMGTGDSYCKAGRYEYMLEQHGLTAERIVEAVSERLKAS